MKHNPHRLPRCLRLIPAAVLVLGGAWLLPGITPFSAAQDPGQSAPAAETPSSAPQGSEQKADETGGKPGESAESGLSAPQVLRDVRDKLESYQSVQADVVETVAVGSRKFTAQGRYLRGSNNRLKLDFAVKLGDGDGGSLTQVCNGQLLWTRWQVGKQSQITRRDIREIQRAVQETRNVPNAELLSDLGLGGIRALLAALETSMDFDAVRAIEIDGRKFYVLQGSWKKELMSQLGIANPEADQTLPPHIPDVARVYVEVETLFPRRIMYLKRHPEKDLVRPMVTLDFTGIQLNAAIDDAEFEYEPPDDVQQIDDTKEYIERLTSPPAAAGKTE